MSQLLLSEDDFSLLRWTCELFFVPESPIYRIDAEAREPADFSETYQQLLTKGVLDASTFRLTDTALNRLAPLTECDARVVLTLPGDTPERPRIKEHYLLDEIAVEYEWADALHCVGQDQDQGELAASLARRLAPRRAGGDYLNFRLTPTEFLVFSMLLQKARGGALPVPETQLLPDVRAALAPGVTAMEPLSPTRRRKGDGTEDASLRHRAALLMAAAPGEGTPPSDPATAVMRPRSATQIRVAQAQGGGGNGLPEDADTVVNPRQARARTASRPGVVRPEVVEPDSAEAAVAGLLSKGIVLGSSRGVELRPSIQAMALGLSQKQRQTLVRFDFSDDEWFVRETSFLATDGSLFSVTSDDQGLLWIMELDARRLEAAVLRAVGPLPETEEPPARSAKDFLLRA